MTLIVSVNTGSRLQLLADTRISHPDVTQVEEVPGRLKLVVLSRSLAVGYAGTSDYALDVIRRVVAGGSLAVREVLPILQTASRDSTEQHGSVEFLAATTEPELSVTLLRDGQVTEVRREGWIGDGDAAVAFESKRAGLDVAKDSDPEVRYLSATIQAFTAIVSEPVVPTVGGLQVRIGTSPQGFRYLEGAMMYFPSQQIPSGVATALHFGGRAEGGFGYTFLVPEEPGVAVLAVHFYQGRLGFVYAPLLSDKPIQVTNVSHEKLREFVLDRFGVSVNGLRFE